MEARLFLNDAVIKVNYYILYRKQTLLTAPIDRYGQ